LTGASKLETTKIMPTTRPSKTKPAAAAAKGKDDNGGGAAAASTKRRLDFASSSSSSSTEEKKTRGQEQQSAAVTTPSPSDKKRSAGSASAFFSPTTTTQNNKKRKTAATVTPEAAQKSQEKEVESSSSSSSFVPTYIHKNLGYDRQGQRKGLSTNTLQCFQLIQEYYSIPSNFEQCRYSENNSVGGPISGSSHEERVIQAYTLGKLHVKPEYNNDKTTDGETIAIKICSCCADIGHMRDDCPALL
jgi:hypothetical protein